MEQKEIKSSEEKNLDESVKKITKTGRDQKEEKRRKNLDVYEFTASLKE